LVRRNTLRDRKRKVLATWKVNKEDEKRATRRGNDCLRGEGVIED